MDTLLPNQDLDGGDEDPSRNGGGGKGNTNHSIKIADATAASMKAHWYGGKIVTIEGRRRTAFDLLSQDRHTTETQVPQVSGKVSTLVLFGSIIAQLGEYPARKAASNAVMAAVDGIIADEGTTAPTHGPGDVQGEQTKDQDAEGDGEDDVVHDEDAVIAMITELQAIANSANPPHEPTESREL